MVDQKGVTLIEIVVCLAILAVLSAIALPPLRTWYRRASIRSEVGLLVGCLHMAKMEAVKADSYVVIETVPDGYSAFVDESHDWIRQANERQIVSYRLRKGLTLASNFRHNKMRFSSRPGITAGRFIMTDIEGRRMDVILDVIGRIRVQ